MIKLLELTKELLILIIDQDFYGAIEKHKEIGEVLSTYKESC